LRNAEPFNLSLLVALLIVSFGLNWIWEMAQMPAFVETAGRSWRQTALQCAVFSLGDSRQPETTELTLFAVRSVGDPEIHQDKSFGALSLRGIKNKEDV
jgi:hypothetical protein